MAAPKRIRSSGSGLGSKTPQTLGPRRNYGSGGSGRRTSGGRSGGRSGGSGGNLAAALDAINARQESLKKVSGDDGGFMTGVSKAAGGALVGALQALDKPRAAVLSLGKEVGDLLEDGEFSTDDLFRQIKDNYTFGEFLRDEVAQTQDWNPIVRGVAGFAGDVAFDPLSWLAPGAKAGSLGAKGVAGALLKQGGEELGEDAARGAAARVLQKRTSSVLSDAERKAAGLVDPQGRVERGIYWNAPGTGRIGRRFGIDKKIDAVTGGRYKLSQGDRLYSKQVRLGGGKRLSKAQELAMAPIARTMNSKRMMSLVKGGTSGNNALAKIALRSGDPEKARNAFFNIEDSARGTLIKKKFGVEAGSRVQTLLHDARKAGIDMKDLNLVPAGSQVALKRVLAREGGAEIAERAKALFNDLRIEANKIVREHGAKDDWLAHHDDYTPHIFNDETREAVGGTARMGGAGKPATIDKKRKYGVLEGEQDTLMGRKLHDPKSPEAKGMSIEEQQRLILQAEVGDRLSNVDGWFELDASKSWPVYVEMLAKRVGDESTAALLKGRGIGVDAWLPNVDALKKVATRQRYVRSAEAARRRLKVAERAERRAARDLERGEQRAATSNAEAAARTKGARQAAQKAASEVGLVDSPGAEAIREFAEFYEDMAADRAATLGRYLNDQNAVMERTSVDVAVMRLDSERLRDAAEDVQFRLRTLSETRSESYEELTTLWKLADDRLQTVPQIRKIEAEIDRATAQIADLNDQMDEIVSALKPSSRRPSEIKADLDATYAKSRSLAGQLTAARKAKDGDAVAAIERELGTNRNFRKALRFEEATSKRMDGETVELLNLGKDEITAHRERIVMLQQAAAEEGRDAEAVAYGLLAERIPVVTEDGLLVNPNWEGGHAFYHGTPSDSLDLVGGSRTGSDGRRMTDSFFGTHWAATEDAAARYARASGTGVQAQDGLGNVVTANLAISNPMIYPKNPDLEWGVMSVAAESHKYGTTIGQGKLELLDDIMSDGIRAGEVTTDDLFDAMQRMYDADLVDDELEALYDLAQNVMDDVAGGLSYRAALTENFSFNEMDPLSWHMERKTWANDAGAPLEPADLVVSPSNDPDIPGGLVPTAEADPMLLSMSDDRVGNWMAVRLEGEIDPSIKERLAGFFREKHGQYDGIMYDHGSYGGWAAVPFDPAQVRGVDGPIRDLPTVKQEIEDVITEAARAKHTAALELDTQVADLTLDAEQAAKRANLAQARLIRLEKRLATQQATVNKRTLQLWEEEAGYLREAQRQYDIADKVQADFVDEQMLKAAQLNVDARLVMDEEAQLAVRNARQVALLNAQYQTQLADLTTWGKAVDRLEGKAADLLNVDTQPLMNAMIDDGYRMFGSNTLLPQDMVESMTAATKMREPDFLKKTLRTFDWVQNLWKGYATMTPGFVARNTLGIIFNNGLADMERIAYKHYLNANLRGGKGVPKEWMDAYNAAVKAGVKTGGQSVHEVVSHTGHVGAARRLFPGTTDFQPIKTVRAASEDAENFGRVSLFMDVYVRTKGDVGAAVEAANKFHFDYDDLSALERSVARRIVPFYTWTRKNVPLQLEMIARKPQKFNRFTQAKAEVELMSEEEGVVPDYFGENMAIRLPFKMGGGNVYHFPDLPFNSVNDVTDPGLLMGQGSPFLKAPFELWAGKQVWNNQKFTDKPTPVPAMVKGIPGLMNALEGVGWANRNAQGEWVMKDRHLYTLGNWVPPFAQARRLFPVEERYQERHLATLLSYMGAGMRANTRSSQSGVVTGAYYDLKDELERLQGLGYLQDPNLARYGPRDPNAVWQGEASESLLERYQESVYEDEEKNSFAPYQPK